jgi:hypothetical protein
MSNNVSAGSKRNWAKTPRKKAFGFLIKYLKSSTLKSKATPYIIKARARFSNNRSFGEKFNATASRSWFGFIAPKIHLKKEKTNFLLQIRS